MAVTLTPDKPNPKHGDTVTVTYSTVPDDVLPLTGVVHSLSGDLPATGQVTVAPSYAAPTSPGLTFTATADPRAWTVVIP